MRTTSALGACLRAAVLLDHGLLKQVHAQIYALDGVAVPAVRSLSTIYAFYIYSLSEAPDQQAGEPFVEFSGLRLNASASAADPAAYASYDSVQLSIMTYQDFWKVIDVNRFCSAQSDVDLRAAEKENQLLLRSAGQDTDVHVHTVLSTPLPNVSHSVARTGIYTLVFSNCGDLKDAIVSGVVTVKNPYGFLPGNEFPKKALYGWLLLIYLALAAVWLLMSAIWWRRLFKIQNCIAVVILLGLLESCLWYIFFITWNSGGVRNNLLFVLATALTVNKATFSYILVLVASLGWGITRPYLDAQVMWKLQGLGFVYIVLDFMREVVGNLAAGWRHNHSLSIVFVLFCLLPVSLLNGAIFAWIFTALPGLMETLKERRQSEKLLLFQRLWWVLLLAIAGATCTLLYQISMFSSDMTKKWRLQWLFTDGVSHVLFLFVLVAIMYLWAPHQYSQRSAYSQTAEPDDDKTRGSALCLGEDGEELQDGYALWPPAKDPKQARDVDVIGAAPPQRSKDQV